MKKFLFFLVSHFALSHGLQAQLTITGQQPTCNGFCNGAARIINQGVTSYHYLWSTGDTAVSVSNLCAGIYQCIVSDSLYMPLDTLNVIIGQPAPLSISLIALKNVACYGDSTGDVKFHVTGGTGTRYSFNWSNGYEGFLSDSAAFNFPAGSYVITITDANSCTASTGFTLIQPPQGIVIASQITNTTSCRACNGSVVVTASGGASSAYSYLWSTGATSSSVTGLCAGGYNITATDTSGCSVATIVNVITAQDSLAVSFSTATNIDCHHPAGFLFASVSGTAGPVHYTWSTGSNAPDIFNIPAGIYQVSVTDSSGCFAVAADTIQNLGIVINTSLQANFKCDENMGQIKIAPTQGTPPYTFLWTGGTSGDSLYGLTPGNYSVTVTDQANCSASSTYIISQKNQAVFLYTGSTGVSCLNIANGSASVNMVNGLAPYVYAWSTLPPQANDTAIGLTIGTYYVSVTDAFGCTVTDSVRIDSNYSQVLTSTTIGNCDSTGSATAAIAIGTPPYTYLWSSLPPQSSATADSLYIGTYSVSVTDSLGCVRTGAADIRFSCTGYVTGTVFYDANANCRIDSGEHGVAGVPVLVTNSNITFAGTTDLSGQYTIPVTEAGTYRVITGVNSSSTILQYGDGGCGYLQYCPVTDTVTFVTLNDTFSGHNFGFVGSPDFDLAIQAGWTPVDASHQKEYWVLYANQAFLTPYTDSATITFNYDPDLTFQSGIPAPVNDAVNHTLTWVVDSIPSPTYIWAKRVSALFTVSSSLPADSQLNNSFYIAPFTGDCDTANNLIYTSDISGLPGRRISKEVNPAGDITPDDSVLTYTIHFRNTGTDTVHIVKVVDSLSYFLNPQSVVTIASNPLFNQFYIATGPVLNWVFNPAALPDSSVDPLNSAGFVTFTVKRFSDVLPQVTISNSAMVYFDNNPGIATNTTHTYITFPTSITVIADNPVSVQVFPNPFNAVTNVWVEGINDTYNFELIDITGRVVKCYTRVTTNRFQINRGDLTAGVYIYRISTNGKPLAYGKLVIE